MLRPPAPTSWWKPNKTGLHQTQGASITTTGLVSRPEHEPAVLALGATSTHSHPESLDEFDAILDTAGIFGHPYLLREGGRIVTVSDDTIPDALEQRATSAVHNYVQHDPRRLHELSALVDEGRLTLRVAEHYPLARIEEAHRRAETGGLLGKIVLAM